MMREATADEEMIITGRRVIGRRVRVDSTELDLTKPRGIDIEPRITGVLIETERCQYRISWWNNGSLNEGYVDTWRCTLLPE